MARKKIDYDKWSKDDLINEITRIKETKYGLVWHRDVPQEKIDILINPDARTPEEMFSNEVAGKPFPVLKEVKKKEIKTDVKNPTNILIEGDNYHSLAVLNFTHKEKIDVIYIDPPYNTGNDDFIYTDNIKSDYVKGDDPFRHSKWISFMEKRLKLAKNLLSSSGSIFISIDDNEQAPLKLLCDEIFGADKFVTTIHVQMSTVQGQKVRAAKDGNIVKNAEYILVYSNGKKNIGKNPLYDPIGYDNHYSIFLEETTGGFKERPLTEVICENDNLFKKLKVLGLVQEKNKKRKMSINNISSAYEKLEDVRDFIHKNSENIVRIHDSVGVKNKEIIKKMESGLVVSYTSSTRSYLVGYNNKKEPKQRIRLSEKVRTADDYYQTYGVTTLRGDWWPGFYLDMGNVAKEGGVEFKNGKKPVRLIKQIINFSLDKNGTVLDFFAGSGTTAQAVLELNKEKKMAHNFILCTNNENDICEERTYPRIKNVVEGFKNKEATGGNMRYFTAYDFVESEPTDKNKRKLVKKSSEMLCVKEGVYDLVTETEEYKIFKNPQNKYLGVIFYEDAIPEFKKELKKIKHEVHTYVFSLGDDPYRAEFKDVKDKVVLQPIPEVILRVYKEIFK